MKCAGETHLSYPTAWAAVVVRLIVKLLKFQATLLGSRGYPLSAAAEAYWRELSVMY